MNDSKKPFESLDQTYFDYLYFVKFCAKYVVDDKRRGWAETLTAAGWTEEEWDQEFDRRYPNKSK
jgi:hypothetical protein